MTTDVAHTVALSERVAEEIRAWQGRRRMTGRELARKLGVSPSWVSYRLTGTQPIDLNDLEMIATALGVSIVDLLPRDRREATSPYLPAALPAMGPAISRPPSAPRGRRPPAGPMSRRAPSGPGRAGRIA